MGNYISLNKSKKSAKKSEKEEIDYKALHRFDKFYSDVRFYKVPKQF